MLDELELLPEREVPGRAWQAGHGDTGTHQYQHAIQASFSAAIERATGRSVIGFASTTSMDEPRFVAEIFKLEAPLSESPG